MSAFYNENDPKAAAWLRELIKEGHIAPGIVDERSIRDIQSNELTEFTQCHFFAGIGGWSLALRLAGWLDDSAVWTGSCPCQPFSVAGRKKGVADERHLWPFFRELIAECRPPIVFGEQVAKKDGWLWLDGIRADLEELDFAFGSSGLCAASVGAPHIRERIYWTGTDRLAHGIGGRWGKGHATSGSRKAEAHASISSQSGRMANPGRASDERWMRSPEAFESDGQIKGETQKRERSRPDVGGGGGNVWLGQSNGARWESRESSTEGARHGHSIEPTGCWSDYEAVNFIDGKKRRIESGLKPLAHGVPGRVGLLRGYGNAIIPTLASEFIQATVEAVEEQFHPRSEPADK